MKEVVKRPLFYSLGHGNTIIVNMQEGAVITDCQLEIYNGAKSVLLFALEDSQKPQVCRTFKCFMVGSQIPEFSVQSSTRYWHIATLCDPSGGYPMYYTIWEIKY